MGGTADGLLLKAITRAAPQRPVMLYIAPDGNIRELDRADDLTGPVSSPDGRYAAWVAIEDSSDRADQDAVLNLADLTTGKILASRPLPGGVFSPMMILDFNGQTIAIFDFASSQPRYAIWRPFQQVLQPWQTVPKRITAIRDISLSADTLLATTGTQDRCLVNVSLSNPDQQRWRACERTEQAWAWISPDGRHVALDVGGALEIRALQTGAVVARLELTTKDLPANNVDAREEDSDIIRDRVWWQSNQSLYVFVRPDRDGRDDGAQPHPLRCSLTTESCERVLASTGNTIVGIAH